MSVGRKRTYGNRLKARAIGAALIRPGSLRKAMARLKRNVALHKLRVSIGGARSG